MKRKKVAEFLKGIKSDCTVKVETLTGEEGMSTDVIKVMIPGKNGKSKGGTAPTIGLLGRLGNGGKTGKNGFCF